ncbi:hypothetical protein LZ198_06215 [Myxococcus sp. K15C18031901]|uniref:hypothetical protein n=1 Tax=Myxococcus dinghuensis TaxID=2906761 RepID=UPI0020A6F111|nr:hypothetical protein [Myxococcus dinghuensis]MCP3098470.1 hypothetical protein [Myxococcus dinghuensis]
MHDTTFRGHGWRPVVKALRLPLVVVCAVLTMGSGMGNPGCGGGDSSPTQGRGGEIQGTYVLRFDDASSLGADCAASGVSLPQGKTLVLSRPSDGVEVTATLEGESFDLTGIYFGGGVMSLDLTGRAQRWGREESPFFLRYVFEGDFSQDPTRADEQVTFSGTFRVTHEDTVEGQPRCSVERGFTATR